ncbi:MAG: hypothetical protein HY319_17415 [Armatimonadetes bacterium]|nr:hypothetical protein [Armatimonadota bacterium]
MIAGRFVLLCLLVVGSTLSVLAQDAASSWDAVLVRIARARDYRVRYRTTGPRGSFRVDYACVKPDRVRMEILEGSDRNVGTVSVYDPEISRDRVLLRFSNSVIARSLTHKDVQGTPMMYRSLFDQIVEKVADTRPELVRQEPVGGHKALLLRFSRGGNKTMLVWINTHGEILRTQEKEGDSLLEDMEFSGHQWDVQPTIGF